MSNSRDLTIRLNAGKAENLNLGEIHLIIATHSPHEGAREILRVVELTPPSGIASDQPTPYDAYLRAVRVAQNAIEEARQTAVKESA